uniref:Uncharacterized protein n=1 Tax=Helianthus annuus TaxID=4232 RepID=A0A251T3G4_HELAN
MISSVFEGLKVIPRSFKQEPSIISSFYSKTHLNLEGMTCRNQSVGLRYLKIRTQRYLSSASGIMAYLVFVDACFVT